MNINNLIGGGYRRRLMMACGKTPTAWYVTDDIFAHFDGIWNAGEKVHTDDPTQIRDLVTGSLLSVEGLQIGSNCVFTTERNTANAVLFPTRSMAGNAELTVEVVLKTTQYRTVNRGGFAGVGSSPCNLFTWPLNSTPYLRFHKNNSNTSTTIRYYADGIAHTFAFRSTMTDVKLFRDGVQVGSWNISGSIGPSDQAVNFRLGGYVGELYAGRVYTRALSVEELQHNYNLDRTRFNL